MSSNSQNSLSLIGRLMLVAFFLPAGISKLTGFEGTVGYISSVGLPLATLGAVLAIVVEIGGSAALLLGYRTRAAALVLALFTLVAGIFFHAYWAAPADQAFVAELDPRPRLVGHPVGEIDAGDAPVAVGEHELVLPVRDDVVSI